jgi:hypothetical protein
MCQDRNKRLLLEGTHGKYWPDEKAMELLQGLLIRLGKAGREFLGRVSHGSLKTEKGEFESSEKLLERHGS